jgi:hypothetical protein
VGERICHGEHAPVTTGGSERELRRKLIETAGG